MQLAHSLFSLGSSRLGFQGISMLHTELLLSPGGAFLCVIDHSKNGTGVRPGPEAKNSGWVGDAHPNWERLKPKTSRMLEDGWQLIVPVRSRKGEDGGVNDWFLRSFPLLLRCVCAMVTVSVLSSSKSVRRS